MNARDFVYWLQGYFEILGEDKPLTAEQVKVIRNHLNMVFKHEIVPSFGDAKHQEELDKLHQGGGGVVPFDPSPLTAEELENIRKELEKPRTLPHPSRPAFHDRDMRIKC